ncbi:hypothetical protein BY996DRAFT_6414787 [Phakopsora pachyrhizi]|nr:hypothetical protein BY996DRAFT_6414787 [Phakopsora pachyrhizi]
MEDENEDEDDLEELMVKFLSFLRTEIALLRDHPRSSPEQLCATPLLKGYRLAGSHPLETVVGILRSECAEVDCGWVKALDQQSDPRLDGSDHSSLNSWLDGTLEISDPVDFGLGVGLGLVVGESGSLRETGLIVWFESVGSSDSICWAELEVFFLVRLGLSLVINPTSLRLLSLCCTIVLIIRRLEDSNSHPDSVRLLVLSESDVDDDTVCCTAVCTHTTNTSLTTG